MRRVRRWPEPADLCWLATGAAWRPLAAAAARRSRRKCSPGVEAKKVDPATRAKAEASGRTCPRQPRRTNCWCGCARTFALLDPNAAKLVELCSEPRGRLIVPDRSLAPRRQRAAVVRRQSAAAVCPVAGARVAVRRGPGAAFGPGAGRRGGSRLAVVLPERGLSCPVGQGVRPEVDGGIAGRRGGQPAAIRRAGAADAGRPQRAARRHARSHRPADGRHPPPARSGPGRTESPPGGRRRHQVARQDDQEARGSATREPGRRQCQ